MRPAKQRSGKVWLGAAGVAVLAVALGVFWIIRGKPSEARAQEHDDGTATPEAIAVKVVKARAEGLERITTQPGTVRAFDYAVLRPKVSGVVLKTVDIDTPVKSGQILAEIDAPELLKDEEHARAAVEQARSQKEQTVARLKTADAELNTARIAVEQKKAEVKRALANLHYRQKEYDRYKSLADYGSVDLKIVDEKFDQLEVGHAWNDSAAIAVKTAEADVKAKEAKIEQANADIKASEANIRAAAAALKRAQVFVEFTKIRAPYDGVVTVRNYHKGDFIKSGDKGDELPILVVQRQDLMRLIIQVPDADVPLCDPGDPVDFTISALTHKYENLKVARISRCQDQKTRTMRVEVDIDNKDGKLRDGMYGDATIHLQKGRKDAVCVPSSVLKKIRTKTVVYVVRDQVAHEVPVQVGQNNGTEAEVVSGLRPNDLVIDHPNTQVLDGVAVQATQEG
jgi:RND family efflux transporter MFP subunit